MAAIPDVEDDAEDSDKTLSISVDLLPSPSSTSQSYSQKWFRMRCAPLLFLDP